MDDYSEINRIVFEVFNGVHNSSYKNAKKGSILSRAKKLFRYLISGYAFSLRKTRRLMNEDNLFQAEESGSGKYRIVVYTVNSGKYDEIKEPIFVDPRIEYVIFTEQDIPKNSIWKKMGFPAEIASSSSLEKARYVKTHPHKFFKDFDYSVFIDGNVRITCDINPLIRTMIGRNKVLAIHRHQARDCVYDEAKAIYAAGKASFASLRRQMRFYKKAHFPRRYGLFETNIIIRAHNDKECVNIMETWWNQMAIFTKRDQLSFTYSLWKNGKTCEYVMSLGNNSRKNPYFIVTSHK